MGKYLNQVRQKSNTSSFFPLTSTALKIALDNGMTIKPTVHYQIVCNSYDEMNVCQEELTLMLEEAKIGSSEVTIRTKEGYIPMKIRKYRNPVECAMKYPMVLVDVPFDENVNTITGMIDEFIYEAGAFNDSIKIRVLHIDFDYEQGFVNAKDDVYFNGAFLFAPHSVKTEREMLPNIDYSIPLVMNNEFVDSGEIYEDLADEVKETIRPIYLMDRLNKDGAVRPYRKSIQFGRSFVVGGFVVDRLTNSEQTVPAEGVFESIYVSIVSDKRTRQIKGYKIFVYNSNREMIRFKFTNGSLLEDLLEKSVPRRILESYTNSDIFNKAVKNVYSEWIGTFTVGYEESVVEQTPVEDPDGEVENVELDEEEVSSDGEESIDEVDETASENLEEENDEVDETVSENLEEESTDEVDESASENLEEENDGKEV